MKKILLASVAFLGMAAIVPAQAADLAARPYTKAPAYAPPAPIYNWTGFYIGGHIGGAFGGNNNVLAPGFVANNNDGRVHGRCAGRLRHAVLAELGVRHRSQLQLPRHRQQSSPTVASARSPAGSATPGVRRCCTSRAATAGLTRASPTASAGNGGRDGYTVGGGLEYLFTQNWSGKVEYQYYDFGTVNFVGPAPALYRRQLPQRPAHHQGRPELSLQLGCSGCSACPGILITSEPLGSEIEKGRHLMPALFALGLFRLELFAICHAHGISAKR